MNMIKVNYLVYAEGTDSEGNRFYFEKFKTRDVSFQVTDINTVEMDSIVLDIIEKDIYLYENKRTSYAFNKSNYKKNNIYGFKDDYPGLTLPVGKVKTTKIEVADIEVV